MEGFSRDKTGKKYLVCLNKKWITKKKTLQNTNNLKFPYIFILFIDSKVVGTNHFSSENWFCMESIKKEKFSKQKSYVYILYI